MGTVKVLGICGSLREGSYNRQLMIVARRHVPAEHAEFMELDLRRYDIPVYNGDIEAAGFPEAVRELKRVVEGADALLIVSPEYNYSIPGGLKNFIDWLSRGEHNSFGGKVAAVCGASMGLYGTVRGQLHLRQCLECLNVMVLPQPQVMVGLAHQAFNPDGSLKDAKTDGHLKSLIEKTIRLTARLKE